MEYDDDSDPFFDENSSSEASLGEDEEWLADLQRIKEDNPRTTTLSWRGENNYIQNMTDEEWEEIGSDIANNHQECLYICDGALNDHKLSCLFRALTRSNTINICSYATID